MQIPRFCGKKVDLFFQNAVLLFRNTITQADLKRNYVTGWARCNFTLGKMRAS